MFSLSKKKSKVSPADKNQIFKPYQYRNKSRTQASPVNKASISKDHIKNTIKKIVYQENSASMKEKEQQKNKRNAKSKMEISIPKFRSSLTPKGFNYSLHRGDTRDRQVQSTKAGDNNKLLTNTNSGRYNFKQIMENRNDSQSKDINQGRQQNNLNNNNDAVKMGLKKIQDATIKFNRDQQFDVQSVLTSQQFEKFGERFPEKFKRVALLGRGGFSVVWLGVHRISKRKIAIKQILTKNPHQTHLKQIWFGSYFFQRGGEARQQFQHHIGINNICKLYSYDIKSQDSWLYYEVCQQSLGGCLFDLKNELINGEKCYRIYYKQLIYRIKDNLSQLKHLIVQISKALHLINSHNIVHSDLKTENILLKVNKKEEQGSAKKYIKSIKLIDFGSSFLFTNLKQFSMATPQYMPPQILNYILFQNKLQYDLMMLNKMEKYKHPWTIDVWSLGCIILQIITGIPLWMSIPTKVNDSGVKAIGTFAVKGRIFQKIIQKQIEVSKNLDFYLTTCNYSGITIDKSISDVLKRMLSLEPEQRISPYQILTFFGVECEPQRVPFY